jgi:hypothetical protein
MFILLPACLLASFLASPVLQTQTAPPANTDPWYSRASRVQFQALKLVNEGFQMEWPKKDWLLVPSTSPLSVVLVSKKGDASIVVERSSLRQPLEASDITDLFAQLESDAIKAQQKALDVQARVIDAGAQRLAAVQYHRDGALGPERVRQYSIPAGKRLYRIVCVSTAAQFLAFDALFAHIASTFAPLPE